MYKVRILVFDRPLRAFFLPKSAPRPCRSFGCDKMAVAGGWCHNHARPRPGTFADRGRGSSAERGYGAAWRKLRTQVLARDGGLCRLCLANGRVTAAAHVDHIVPRSVGGSDELPNFAVDLPGLPRP